MRSMHPSLSASVSVDVNQRGSDSIARKRRHFQQLSKGLMESAKECGTNSLEMELENESKEFCLSIHASVSKVMSVCHLRSKSRRLSARIKIGVERKRD